jgi:catechol 2,3-dioxygenase-like lactoylglutathione lyase family enzyme
VSVRFHHTGRATARLEACLRFYAALGCREEKRVRSDEQGLTRVVLTLPESDAALQFIAFDDPHWTPPGETWADHLAFHTSAFDDTLTALLHVGAILEREPYTLPGRPGRIGFVFDPDGHRVELVERDA